MTKKAVSKEPGLKAEVRDQLLGELRGGAEGVRRWNARPSEERQQGGDFRGVDLSGAMLGKVDLGSLDFQGACLDGATLSKAWLLECDLAQASLQEADLTQAWCAGANFQGANLKGATLARANLRSCNCRGANFQGANLEGTTLSGANLCGADLSGARVRGAAFQLARYDEQTRWPQGSEEPAGARWVGSGKPPVDFDVFVKRVAVLVDQRRLGRALEMLKADHFQLYSQVEADSVVGVVKSQNDPALVYSCRLTGDGSFACCTQDLALCLGLRGALCKHILVLIVGLARAGKVDAAAVERWVQASRKRKPVLDTEVMSETLLRYKGAEAGEVDWRPTETLPEDYYAL